ncbi:hypothetical protein [Streptomyces hainanensis]|uniref:MBL fold metallo-hydrolase n=1 Tax=Streptomyces hainanensis TaxID=402648 RepID=A0A4R4SRX7_9ACTN|nr:hypothetical protein [Streptomyces hainanensis]TDC65836.1 hypothetical protein E1283_30295 [Streptomyces hainanensis]
MTGTTVASVNALGVTLSPSLRQTRTLVRFPRTNPDDTSEPPLTVLVDCGGAVSPLPADVRRLDHVILTHPDVLHHGAIAATATVPVDYAHYGGDLGQYSASTRTWLRDTGAWNLPLCVDDLSRSMPYLSRGGAQLFIVSANASGRYDSGDTDANAVVPLFVVGSHAVLLLGDAPTERAWRSVTEAAKPKGPLAGLTQLLVVGHPAARDRAAPPWCPAAGVVVGTEPYGPPDPHPGVLAVTVRMPGTPPATGASPLHLTWTTGE